MPNQYTVEVNTPDVPGEGKPRRAYFCADKLIDGMPSGVKNLYENFASGVKVSGDLPCLGKRVITNGVAGAYEWQTYNQVHEACLNLGSGLAHLKITKGSMVGIFSVNRIEWVVTEQACNAYNLVTVPLYDTLGPEAIEFIINQTEMPIIVTSNDKLKQLLAEKSKYPGVHSIITFEPTSEDENKKAESLGVKLYTFEEVQKFGQENRITPTPGDAEDLVTIMYTSGTTGLPKGVMLCHKNILSDAGAVDFCGTKGKSVQVSQNDVHISYLPLAHVFERMVVTYCLGVGAAIGFFQGSAIKLLDDIGELKPTLFPSVPRLLNRVYDKVNAAIEVQGGFTSMLYNMAVSSKTAGLRSGYLTHWLWDRLVFSKVKARLGGRVKCIVTASAPISPEVLDFLRLAFCCEVHEAYGQTESCGGSTLTLYGDYESGNVGVPFPCNEIKLVDVPDMNYSSKDEPYPRGEICFRGPNVFLGYFKNEEKTKEALDEQNWLHSGDIGLWDEKGRLKIIDRKKNIFKLAQGEYIAPEKIENVYSKSKWVAQAFIYGDSLRAFLIGVIIPDEENLVPWAKANSISGTFEEIIKDPKVKELILQDMLKVGKELGLKPFEQVKEIHLDSTLFSVENNLLTPTFKLKRPQATEFYQSVLDEMNESVQKREEEKEKKQHIADELKRQNE